MARLGIGKLVRARLYLEGFLVENAFHSVQVSGHTGAPATAQIDLVPTNTIKHIMPGTYVHVFTTDPWDLEPAGDVSDFKLLFEGVVVSRGFSKQDDGRSFVIQCADPSVYWVEARQYWLNIASANGGIVDQLAVQTSGGYGRFGTVSSTGTYGYMATRLAFTGKDQPEENFMNTMISVIDDIGNVNPFYTNIRNRFRLTDRILRAPAGKTQKLFQLALFSDFIEGLSGSVSGQSNLAQVVNQLLSSIMHEWVSVPAPPYIRGARIFDRDIFGNIKKEKNTVKRTTRRGSRKVDLYEYKTAIDDIIGTTIFKPHVYTISPPTCNVLFPNMYDQFTYNENFMHEPTRLSMKPQLPLVSRNLTQGLLLQRPTELEIFTGLVRDASRGSLKKRTPDAKFADGFSQVPTFTDYDWSTNEERIRGINYNFINLAPAPSTLTMSDPGKRTPAGARKGGVPKYLQNVASYEYYKAKFGARQSGVAGPYNMRVVPGFPMLILDDSEAGQNIVCYLSDVTHHINADGSATTSYGIKYPRMVDEVDYNRPRFKATSTPGALDFDLFRDAEGNYSFESLFDGENQPPVPEWFDERFSNNVDLDAQYQSWFGERCRVVQSALFIEPSEDEEDAIAEQEEARAILLDGVIDAINNPEVADEILSDDLKDDILENNQLITLSEATAELNERFRKARIQSREFEEVSSFTDRSFTRIDQAFRFVGASPRELSDNVRPGGEAEAAQTGTTFNTNPAAGREIDFGKVRLDRFVGDASPGSGYSARPEGDKTKTRDGDVNPETGAFEEGEGTVVSQSANRMSGAFAVFDTRIHTGDEATDPKIRSTTAKAESTPSVFPRFDGRPLMFDFEFRLWLESLRAAGFSPTGEKIADAAELATHYVVEGGSTRPATAEERAAAAQLRQERLEQRRQERASASSRGRHNPEPRRCPNMPPKEQAPTGDGLEQELRHPLPQPLSEKQVIDLRRKVIEAYRDELARNRGFTG